MVDKLASTPQRLTFAFRRSLVFVPRNRNADVHAGREAGEKIVDPNICPNNLTVRGGDGNGVEVRLKICDLWSGRLRHWVSPMSHTALGNLGPARGLFFGTARPAGSSDINPSRGVVARLAPSPHLAIHAGAAQPGRKRRAEKQVVHSQTSISTKCIPKVIPVGVDYLVRMCLAHRVSPALIDETGVERLGLREKNSVANPAFRLVGVQIGGNSIVIPAKDDCLPCLQ